MEEVWQYISDRVSSNFTGNMFSSFSPQTRLHLSEQRIFEGGTFYIYSQKSVAFHLSSSKEHGSDTQNFTQAFWSVPIYCQLACCDVTERHILKDDCSNSLSWLKHAPVSQLHKAMEEPVFCYNHTHHMLQWTAPVTMIKQCFTVGQCHQSQWTVIWTVH